MSDELTPLKYDQDFLDELELNTTDLSVNNLEFPEYSEILKSIDIAIDSGIENIEISSENSIQNQEFTTTEQSETDFTPLPINSEMHLDNPQSFGIEEMVGTSFIGFLIAKPLIPIAISGGLIFGGGVITGNYIEKQKNIKNPEVQTEIKAIDKIEVENSQNLLEELPINQVEEKKKKESANPKHQKKSIGEQKKKPSDLEIFDQATRAYKLRNYSLASERYFKYLEYFPKGILRVETIDGLKKSCKKLKEKCTFRLKKLIQNNRLHNTEIKKIEKFLK